MSKQTAFALLALILLTVSSCRNRVAKRATKEQLVVDNTDGNQFIDTLGVMLDSVTVIQPSKVILTGMPNHRLVSVYKHIIKRKKREQSNTYTSYYSSGYEEDEYDTEVHFMPGIDILFGYNLVNVAHHDLATGQTSNFFSKPVIVKSLYYPSVEPDTLKGIPVKRNFYLVSAYDEDTNKDTLLNKRDLRHFYLIDEHNKVKTQLVPADYSVMRSQYDADNDAMYIFARHDANKNGMQETTEPIHIFWFSLKTPDKAKRLY